MKSRDKVLDLIQKLLRMAKDKSSPNEAAIALQRARKLMDEHQISELEAVDSSIQTGFGQEVSARSYKSMPIWQQSIALEIGKLNDTTVSFQYNCTKKSIRFSGFAGDAITSILMYEYLCETVEGLCKDVSGRKAKAMFKMGFAHGIKKKIEMIRLEREKILITDGRSLVTVKSAMVEARFGKTYSESSRYDVTENRSSYERGVAAGKKASLSRQVAEHRLALPAA